MRVAVVIPALDEAESVADAIRSARGDDDQIEVLVVDGGSEDGTRPQAEAAGADVMGAPRGRACQLEAGWRASGADVILFLHADTRLEPGWLAALGRALEDPEVVGGAFRLRFDSGGAALRFIEWGARLRVALFALPYGDQAIFVRRSVLERIGGIPPASMMEDLDLVHALKREGRLVALPLAATTSARRYLRGGPLRTMLRHWLALLAWRLGLDRTRLLEWSGR